MNRRRGVQEISRSSTSSNDAPTAALHSTLPKQHARSVTNSDEIEDTTEINNELQSPK